MRERFGATDPRSWALRFHTQTGGATLTAQQPQNNIVRTALQALASVLGGTQSLHTNAFDEALALPTEHSATIALRTQQVIGYETGVTESVDPLAGSYFVESLTDELERSASRLIETIDDMGGAVRAIEAGFYQDQIHDAAFRIQQGIESGERVVVGVNRFAEPQDSSVKLQRIAEEEALAQVERLRRLRAARDRSVVDAAVAAVRDAAGGTANLLPPMKDALRSRGNAGRGVGRAAGSVRGAPTHVVTGAH